MPIKALAGAAVAALIISAAPAHAANWSKNVDICASAAEAEGFVTAGEYRAKYLSGKGGAVKTVTIELIGNEGEAQTAVCKIRRGVVNEINLES